MYFCFQSMNRLTVTHYDVLRRHSGPSQSQWFTAWGSLGVDEADTQWRDFVRNMPVMGPALLLLCLAGRGLRTHLSASPVIMQTFYALTGLAFVSYLHGPHFLFALALVLINYFVIAPLHRWVPYSVFLGVMWTAHVGILFVNDAYRGYRFAMLSEHLRWCDESLPQGALRWHIVFNMCTLRMIAYNNDYYEACQSNAQERREKVERFHASQCVDCAKLQRSGGSGGGLDKSVVAAGCYKQRTDSPRLLAEYNLRSYLAYLFYVPLYIAGPMSSFNAFVSHTVSPHGAMTVREGLKYFSRIAGIYFLLTFQLHFNFLNAFRAEQSVMNAMTHIEKFQFFLLTLGFLWMKFSILWKLFRLLALVDGVEAPEDMNRCFANTLTIQSFWRDWHSSFNHWIVRYMYIPLGGSKNKLFSVFPIFVFIAVWHDIELHLLWWALIMCICFIPEVLAGLVLSHPKVRWVQHLRHYRYIRAAGGACGMVVLITANLVGYGTGTRSMEDGYGQGLSWEIVQAWGVVMFVLYCGAVIAVRDREAAEAERKYLRALYGVRSPSSEASSRHE